MQDVRLAKQFEDLVKLDNRFELVQEAAMGIVCFRLKVIITVHYHIVKHSIVIKSCIFKVNLLNIVLSPRTI